jgi:Tetratricopeptide repeat
MASEEICERIREGEPGICKPLIHRGLAFVKALWRQRHEPWAQGPLCSRVTVLGQSRNIRSASGASPCRNNSQRHLSPHKVLRWLALILLFSPQLSPAQDPLTKTVSPGDPLGELRKLHDASDWEGILRLIPSAGGPAEHCFYRGLALSRLQRWELARQAFEAGRKGAPSDARFPRELAGTLFQLKQFREAKKSLRRALKLDASDAYAKNFLATLYFLEENLEGALKYWNPDHKPLVDEISSMPQPRLKPDILDRAFAVAPASQLLLQDFRNTQAWLDHLEIFPSYRFELKPKPGEQFDLLFHPVEKNGWGKKSDRILSVVRGIPALTARIDLFNLKGQAINFESRARFDAQKRGAFSEISAPLGGRPAWRGRFYADARKENWDLSRSYQRVAPLPGDLRLRRLAAGFELNHRVNWNWEWKGGFELSYRDFRNLPSVPSESAGLFTPGVELKYLASVKKKLWRVPEQRFTLQSSAGLEAGKLFRGSAQRFTKLRGSLEAEWFPQAKGDDYRVTARFRAGRADGRLPFDELFIFGLERDNDLWLRGHVATENRKRGSGLLGQDYLLWNWEMDKRIYQKSFLDLSLGPAVDTGRIYDKDHNFGSAVWLTDLSVLLKMRFRKSTTIIFSYGKDLQTGRNAFYVTTSR